MKIRDCHETFSNIYKALQNGMKALYHHEQFKLYADSINNLEVEKKTSSMSVGYEYEKKRLAMHAEQEKKELLHLQELEEQRFLTYGFIGAFVAMIAVAALVFRSMKKEKKAKELLKSQHQIIHEKSQEILTQNEEIMQQNEEILVQKEYIEQSFDNLQLLSSIGKKITQHISVEGVIATVYAEVNRLMPAEGFGIGVFNEKKNRVEYPGFIEKGEKLPFHYDKVGDGDSLSDICFNEQCEILINDMDAEIGKYLSETKIIAGEKSEAVIYLPLAIKNKTIGNITVQSFQKNVYSNTHLNLLRNIAAYVAIALDNSKLYGQSETLLLNILPYDTAQELKEKGYASTKSYEQVSVLFTDFKGFTAIAEKMTPEEVVENLGYCFKAFDRICRKHKLEKIKTIGDAYMAAGGIPMPDGDNARRAVDAALEMVVFMNSWKLEKEAKGEKAWEVRIGIHTGPLVAGVVGEDKFAYDIWGDTVNTASRMESTGVSGKVNISDATHEILAQLPDYRFEYRGEVEAKGKGKVGMWFVEGIK